MSELLVGKVTFGPVDVEIPSDGPILVIHGPATQTRRGRNHSYIEAARQVLKLEADLAAAGIREDELRKLLAEDRDALIFAKKLIEASSINRDRRAEFVDLPAVRRALGDEKPC